MLEQLSLYSKKYMFSVLIIVLGAYLLYFGMKIDPVTKVRQTDDFILGASAILIAGIISLLYTLDVINKVVNLILLTLLFIGTGFFAYKSYKSIMLTIEQRNNKEKWDETTKQALQDIRDVQVAYKKKHGYYASDYNELKRFLKEDKVMDIVIKGDIPDRRITEEEGKKLGYDKINDHEKYNDIDELEAAALGIITIDTLWYPVMEVMFTGETAQKNNEQRLYPFDVEELGKLPKEYLPKIKGLEIDNIEYPMYTDTIREGEDLIAHLYIYDPVCYDPFGKKDTLKIGSKTEPKTNGSWVDK